MMHVTFNLSLLSAIKQTVRLFKLDPRQLDYKRSLQYPLEADDSTSLSSAIRYIVLRATLNSPRVKSIEKPQDEKFDIGDIFVIDVSNDSTMPKEQLIAKKWLPLLYLGQHYIERNEHIGPFHNFEAVYEVRSDSKLPTFAGYSIPVTGKSKLWKNISRVA